MQDLPAPDPIAVSRTLAAAFADDPVWSWLLPDTAARLRRLERFFRLEVSHVALPRGEVLVGGDGQGACLAMPPGAWRMPLGAQVLHGPSFLRVFGRRTPLALALITRLEGRHIREPHVYVAYVGVAPAGQGRGIGSALLRRVLDRCDADGLPAYLEASSPRNRALYERHGFVTLGELRLRDSPPLWPMRYAPPG